VIFTLDRLEMDDHVPDDSSSLDSTLIRAGTVSCAHEHSDGDLVDTSKVDQGSLALTFLVVGSELLEAVRVGVLPPVRFRLNRHGLAPVAARVVTCLLTELVADLSVVSIPVRAVNVVNTDRREGEQGVFPVALGAIYRADRARSEGHKLVEVVLQERLLDGG